MLIEMHGNNGSVDGDPPAAMRYTEARLICIAAEMLRDIEKEQLNLFQTLMTKTWNRLYYHHVSQIY